MESTSHEPEQVNADGEEDIVDLCRRLDTKLEEKAKMHNLNALNVKSILHRLIKDPHILTTLMGIKGDTDDIPSVKVTRSKVKHRVSEAAKVELKPVPPPRTFLDVQFENEDDDEDYRPEEVNSGESDDEEEANEALTIAEPDQVQEGEMNASAVDQQRDEIAEDGDTEVPPYQLRSRVPHIDENYPNGSLNTTFNQDSLDTFMDYQGQEMLTFVENPDYLSFLQGIHASTPSQENDNPLVDDDDPDDEEYNVLTELEGLTEIEKDKDELRMDKFTEIPMREVEGLFLDLIGDDVQTISPELILQKTSSPMKKRFKRRSTEIRKNKDSKDDSKVLLPVDKLPPDGSYSCSLISGRPIQFKSEELDQLRIQLEQHVQLLTQSVVMCYHDERLAHVKNQYQLMINELDSRYYHGGESSAFNISNLAAAIESCHDIMGVSRVDKAHIKWEPTPFGWSPRPEAALVLGRSRAVIYPDLLPGVQPDLFDHPHQFFTHGEDLLLAQALIQFRHVPNTSSQSPYGRLYWVQKMFLPCKTVSQIRSHIRIARQHAEGQVSQRNPLYQIIIQALRGVCHLRFPFERPVARYETLQMWPEEERPIWYNKFLRSFTTLGPTMVVPRVDGNDSSVLIVWAPPNPEEVNTNSLTQPCTRITSSTVCFVVDVGFYKDDVHLATGVDARPFSFHYETVSASFSERCAAMVIQEQHNVSSLVDNYVAERCPQGAVSVKDEPDLYQRALVDRESLSKRSRIKISYQNQNPLDYSTNNLSSPTMANAGDGSDMSPSLPHIPCDSSSFSVAEPQFSVFEPSKEFNVLPTERHEELRLPKSEFSLKTELEESEAGEDLHGTISAEDRPKNSLENTPLKQERIQLERLGAHSKRARNISKSVSTPLKCRRDCDKTSTRRSRNRPSIVGENSPQQSRKRGNAYQVQNEVEKAKKRCRSKRMPLNSELEPVGCLSKKKQKMENAGNERVSNSSTEQVSTWESHKEDEEVINYQGNVHNIATDGGQSPLHLRPEIEPNSVQENKVVHEASCYMVSTLCAPNQSMSACQLIEVKSNDLIVLQKDIVTESRKETQNVRESSQIMDGSSPHSSCSPNFADAEACAIKSSSKTWKDCDYTNDEYDNDTLALQSDTGTYSMMREIDSSYIPKTPTFNTPSDYSPVESISHLNISRTPSPGCDPGIPVTPRDDVLTRSPTLLRAPPAVSRALFSKIQIKRVPVDKVDLASNQTSSNCLKDAWGSVDDYSLQYSNVRPSTQIEGGDQMNDDSEDAPGSEMYSAGDELDVSGKTRMKRRTRTEKERMGLERMQNPHHRTRQMVSLARKIAVDIKQRTFMHQDVWQTVERIVLGDDTMETQFDRLKAALLPKHADVLVLLSLLADESILPPELHTSPLRRAYHGAVEMLLAIEAYCHGTRSRSSNTRSLLKTIGSMGQTLSEVEFCDRLADLLGNERPLWNYIRQWLPLTYDEKVTSADFEFIDLCSRTDSELIEDGGAECIDDLNAVLGAQPPRKGGSLQVHAGQLNSLQNGVYVPILVSKADAQNERPEAEENGSTEPTWTKELDMLILHMYNDIDGTNEEVIKEIARKIPYSIAHIERRLNFLISLFKDKSEDSIS